MKRLGLLWLTPGVRKEQVWMVSLALSTTLENETHKFIHPAASPCDSEGWGGPICWGWILTAEAGLILDWFAVFLLRKNRISQKVQARTRKRGQNYPLPRVLMEKQDYKLTLIMWPLSNLCGQLLMFLKKYLFTVGSVPKLSLTSEFLFRIVFIPTEEEPCWSITVLQ